MLKKIGKENKMKVYTKHFLITSNIQANFETFCVDE